MPLAWADSTETDDPNKASATMLPMMGRELTGIAENILANIGSLR